MIRQPVFLVGAERSGTTLLRLMLCHHPQLAWNNEFDYSVELISPEGNFPNLANYYEWLTTHRIFEGTGFHIDPSLSYAELVNSFLEQKKQQENKPLVGATVHHHFPHLLQIWPDARFIHLVRDGRDVAKSCLVAGWAGNFWYACERWQTAELLWENLVENLPNERWLQITYEELIAFPKRTLTKTCQFLGILYTEAMLNYPEDSTYASPDPALIQKWPSILSQEEIKLTEARIGDLLVRRGYSLSGLPQMTVSPSKIKQLSLQNWLYKVNFRRNRYGFFLLLSDHLSRRLNLEKWQKSIKLKLNRIDKKHLK